MAGTQTSVTTTTDVAFAGMTGDSTDADVRSYLSEEASAEIRFGIMVAQGVAETGALIFAANTNKAIGVVRHSHGYAKDTELGDTGLKSKVTLGVLSEGTVWVLVDETVAVGDAVRVRGDTNGGTTPGVFCKTTSAGHTIDISKFARWVRGTTTLADGTTKVALLSLDMTGRANASAD